MSGEGTRPVKETASFRDWVAVWATVVGAFMAVFNIHVTNASLKDIIGSLSATLDEGSWISTAYLTAEIVVIPLTAWLARVFSIRRYIVANAALFVAFSVLTAQAWSLNSMIVFRVFSGLAGGVLIPLCFTAILTILPPRQRTQGFALFGITATLAPSIGPTLGGWLSENYGWQYTFYLQIVPGALMIAGLLYGLDRAPMRLDLLRKGHWLGAALMAVGLGSLEIVLEEGLRKDWFGSWEIVWLSIVAAVSLCAFLAVELRRNEPFLNLRLLWRRDFACATVINVLMGFVLYGFVYIMPLYLAQIQGFNAMQIGEVMMWVGIPQILLYPLVGRIATKVDNRFLVATGIVLFTASLGLNTHLSRDSAAAELLLPNLVRAVGQPFIMVPLSNLAMAGIEAAQVGSASALYNVLRNLGGSVGIASLGTFLSVREKLHSARILENLNLFDGAMRARLDQWTQYFLLRGADSDLARQQAYAALGNIARREAYIMAYNDVFLVLTTAFASGLIFLLFVRRPKSPAGGAALADRAA